MTTPSLQNLHSIFDQFQIEGDLLAARPITTGHINDTYIGEYRTADGITHYVHQRINQYVFKQPVQVMENIQRVTRHIQEKVILEGGNPKREALNLIPALDGKPYCQSEDGSYWRTYLFIDGGARTYEVVEDLRHVHSAASAFGKFQQQLADLPGERLHETIPDFHHTRKRFAAFTQAVEKDARNRAITVKEEIDFILQREADAAVVVSLIEKGELPERVTHNDTKLNNVLISDETNQGICVLDLDTVMPGTVLYDFGDMIRTGTATAAEDERDLAKVGVDLCMFERLTAGYCDAACNFLLPVEWENLAFSGKLITFEQAIRFLGDYLNGDIYYKTDYPEHNLHRARTQITMVAEMEQKMEAMQAIVEKQRIS
jgi:aminoglycoside phosphotransferase (APT) family kinase protein